jgi:hypothetical protein
MDSKQLFAEALRLSDEERAALAGELIQSLEHDVDAEAEAGLRPGTRPWVSRRSWSLAPGDHRPDPETGPGELTRGWTGVFCERESDDSPRARIPVLLLLP